MKERRRPGHRVVRGLLHARWVLALPALGCGTVDVPVLSAGADAGPPAPAHPAASLTLSDFCSGSGPPVLVDALADGGSVSTCPSQLAQQASPYALCTCGDYTSDHALATDAFDGSTGSSDAASAAGGTVGVNGALNATGGTLVIGGSLWASTSTDIDTGAVTVYGDLHAQGEMVTNPSLFVGGDAWMARGIQATGNLTVKGTLHVPAGEPVEVSGTQSVSADEQDSTPFAQACNCGDLVDVAGLVATYEAQNDDATLQIDRTSFENVQAPVDMSLPCGRIYLTHVGSSQAITLRVTSRVVLVVGDYISTTADFTIDVTGAGELDLLVGGSIVASGSFFVGDPANPSNPAIARTYVGGTSVNFQNTTTMTNLYAPYAEVVLGASAPTTLYGPMFVSAVSASADLTLHDGALMTPASTVCPVP
jgi:hypothetical protein